MLNNYLQAYFINIVFLGDFNPAILQPYWLLNKKLIREQEANTANIQLIHNELVKCKLDWAEYESTKDRFLLKSSQEPYFNTVKDLAIGIFKNLPETPLRALGINHIKHFALPNKEAYYNFGDKLAPFSNWDTFIKNPRLFQLEIIEQERKDKLKGSYRVKILPSDVVPSNMFGVSIAINDHFETSINEPRIGNDLLEILITNWQASFERCDAVIENLWKNLNS